MVDEFDGVAVFLAVAETKGFRAAGERLGVSGSAVSQAMQRLEARLGVALVRRTTRSVRLTDAGERLYATARPAVDELRSAVAALGELADEPRGTVRLHASRSADTLLAGSFLADFLTAHPQLRLDLVVSDAPVDVVAEGYDAGIQLGETIDRDMVAVPVTGDLRLMVVGAPSYFVRHPRPTHPRELVHHACINWRPHAGAPPYRWEFTEGGREFSVAVPTRVLSTDAEVILRLACAGVGLAIVYDRRARDLVARGELVSVLDEFSTPFPGYYLYYPERRHASPGLRALIAFLRGARRPLTASTPRRTR